MASLSALSSVSARPAAGPAARPSAITGRRLPAPTATRSPARIARSSRLVCAAEEESTRVLEWRTQKYGQSAYKNITINDQFFPGHFPEPPPHARRCLQFNKRFGMAKMSAKGYVGEALAVEAELTLVLAKGE
eukprot:jgi/Tetstr1/460265/TSEL_005565.t1